MSLELPVWVFVCKQESGGSIYDSYCQILPNSRLGPQFQMAKTSDWITVYVVTEAWQLGKGQSPHTRFMSWTKPMGSTRRGLYHVPLPSPYAFLSCLHYPPSLLSSPSHHSILKGRGQPHAMLSGGLPLSLPHFILWTTLSLCLLSFCSIIPSLLYCCLVCCLIPSLLGMFVGGV
jgi:hypothetical protein